MRVVLIAGARPNFMKIAPVLSALEARGHETVLVHTEQHYDQQMSETFFSDLNLRKPDYQLGVGSGTHAEQTARVLLAFEPVIRELNPDWVVVPGDVNSTLACGLATAKLKPEIGCRLAHLEAGLRSFDWRMPEEINRVLTDRLSDLLLTPSRDADANLVAEGIDRFRIEFVGNVMIDTLFRRLPGARKLDAPSLYGLHPGDYVVATLHRPSNVDQPEALTVCLALLSALSQAMPVLLPMHPRTRQRVQDFGLESMLDTLRVTEPLGYTELLSLVDAAAAVVTDSGGLQEETTALGVPCVTLREQTERPITVARGTNRLPPWPLTLETALHTCEHALRSRATRPTPLEGWDGRAACRVVAAMEMHATADLQQALPMTSAVAQ